MEFLLNDQQAAVMALAERFAREEIAPQAAAYDRRAEYPYPIVEAARGLGFTHLIVPEAYGGPGLDTLDLALVAEALGWGCAGIAVAILLNNLVADAILIGGSEAQKRRYLPRLAREVASYALTEPGAGSDAAAIQTRAFRQGRTYVLRGQKTWISHATEASFFVVFAKTDPGRGHRGISAFLVEREAKGVEVGPPLAKLGQKASPAAEVTFDDVELPLSARLGEEGEGFSIAMRVFDRSRPMVAALATGLARRALDEARRYAGARESFGKKLFEHQAVGFKLAEMGMRLAAARLLTREAAWKAARGVRNTLEAAYAKAFAAEVAVWASGEAVQIFGGYGYSEDYPLAKLYRDAKVFPIYEGTSEIQRLVMVRELMKEVER